MSEATYELSQAQRDHMAAVYELAGVNPKAGTLRYSMMDDGTGSGRKKLTLYGTKGFTNAVRAAKNISVVEMTSAVIGTAISVTAKAKIEDTGRTDMAMAAVSIENKSGRGLENAIAAAQTKATRRVTLQIAGLDLIDESEVADNDKTVALESANVPLSEIALPPEVSKEAAKDVTDLQTLADEAIAKLRGSSVVAAAAEEIPAKLPNPAAGLPIVTDNLASSAVPPRKKRTKSTTPKAEAALASIAAVPTVAIELLAPETKAAIEPVLAKTEFQVRVPAHVGDTVVLVPDAAIATMPLKVKVKSATVVADMPSSDQMKGYVDRLTDYRTRILPDGGMVASFGMAVNKKLREFVRLFNGGMDDPTKLTNTQWVNTFAYLDSTLKDKGSKELVNIIEFNVLGENNGAGKAA